MPSNVTTWYPLAPNPHPSVIAGLVETWLLHGREWFDSKIQGLRMDRGAIVRLCNEYLEEHGEAGPIRRIQ